MTFKSGTPRKALRTTEVRCVNRRRKAKSWIRSYGSEERVEFVKSLPCIAWGSSCWGEIQNAHVVKGDGGASYKASAEFIAPLCDGHHRCLHRDGPYTFADEHRVDLAACAAATAAAWDRREDNG
jgi:hypothetical protein